MLLAPGPFLRGSQLLLLSKPLETFLQAALCLGHATERQRRERCRDDYNYPSPHALIPRGPAELREPRLQGLVPMDRRVLSGHNCKVWHLVGRDCLERPLDHLQCSLERAEFHGGENVRWFAKPIRRSGIQQPAPSRPAPCPAGQTQRAEIIRSAWVNATRMGSPPLMRAAPWRRGTSTDRNRDDRHKPSTAAPPPASSSQSVPPIRREEEMGGLR